MRNDYPSLYNAFNRDAGGVAVVLCSDIDSRDSLAEDVEDIIPSSAGYICEKSLEAALAMPSRAVVVLPDDEREAVLDLEASRELILNTSGRTQPVLLFLLREGPGGRTLAEEAVGFESWVGGGDIDPELLSLFDPEKERVAFVLKHKMTTETWLAKERSRELPNTVVKGRVTSLARCIVDLGEAALYADVAEE